MDEETVTATVVASMGPRPCGRGNWYISDKWVKNPTSFNGAAPLRARKPCQRSPGMRAVGGFNGAAPLRARKPGPRGASRRGTRCFNGAAPLRARKPGPIFPAPRRRRSFNGAAPLRARKLLRYVAAAGVSAVLQWGRALAGAETYWTRTCPRTPDYASMGPRPCGRGNRFIRSSCDIDLYSFNGAAPLRARKRRLRAYIRLEVTRFAGLKADMYDFRLSGIFMCSV